MWAAAVAMLLAPGAHCLAAGGANDTKEEALIVSRLAAQGVPLERFFGYVLGTSAVARARSLNPDASRRMYSWPPFTTNAVWNTKFWLWGVKGIAATGAGFSNALMLYYGANLVSPRHILFVDHVKWQYTTNVLIRFIGTDNVGANHAYHWARCLGYVPCDPGPTNQICVGLLDRDMPRTVGFYTVLPTNYLDYAAAGRQVPFQGLGYSQDDMTFSQAVYIGSRDFVAWDSGPRPLFGLSTNWGYKVLRSGDSSNPVRLLVGDQLVLLAVASSPFTGPAITSRFDRINECMHYLSKTHGLSSDYQLTTLKMSGYAPFK